MLTNSEQLRLVDRIYEGAFTNCGWTHVLRDLADAFRSETANFSTVGLPTGRIGTLSFFGIEPCYQGSYGALAGLPDMQQPLQRLAALVTARVVTDEHTVPDSGLLQSRFANEWLRPQGMDHHMIAIYSPTPSEIGGFFFARPRRVGGYDADAVVALKVLQPHLTRAMQVYLRLAAADTARANAVDVLDQCPVGVLLVDQRCDVLWANRAAEGLLRVSDRLSSVGGALTCHRADETRRLHRLVGGCWADPLDGAGGMLAVHSHSGRRPLSVLVAPLRGERPSGFRPAPTAVLFVTDPERSGIAPRSHLRELYGLTDGEARTAEALLDSDGLADAAQKLGVTLATVRTLLQRVFEKTDTHRQAELVRLMLAHRVH